jgi:hypothetical protein
MCLDVISADDVGAINPAIEVDQGAVVQAAGCFAENFVRRWLCPTQCLHLPDSDSLDIPERVQSLILEYSDPLGPWGVRGMAEMPYLPLTPAIIAAVHEATGVWYYEFPLIPERVLRGLSKI